MNHDIRPYDEIPEATKDYANFIVRVSELGDSVGPFAGLEDRRIKLHHAMVDYYGLEYENTRGAVALLEIGFNETTDEKMIAMLLDQRMRNLKDCGK